MSETPREWNGDEYQQKFDALADRGVDVHGEVAFLLGLEPTPTSVLDAGCGTGRVAVELDARGIEAAGADLDESMLATARGRAPHLEWAASDLASLNLGRVFDVVVMAGNVPLFTTPGTEGALVAGVARHVVPGGFLVAGFSLGRGYEAIDYDAHCVAAGLAPTERFSTWDRSPFVDGTSDYLVSVCRKPA